jgi:Zn-dependent M28 family amino/carboxypeptidase
VIPQFNEDSAYQFIQRQVDFGPRIPNTKAHEKAGDYLVNVLQSYNISVIEQRANLRAHTGEFLKARNIIAEINPTMSNRVLLCAHWDTRPFADKDPKNPKATFDGADDGGSGVGVLLEIARIINNNPINIGIDIILFDAEDFGDSGGGAETYCLGSQYWAANPHRAGYYAKYGILLDMVGAKDAKFPKEGWSMKYAPSIVEKVWNQASILGYGQYFINQQSAPITDDHYFINTIAKIPCIDIINYNPGQYEQGFAPHWHTQKDDMSIIDKNTLKAVGQTLLHLIYQEK